MECDSANCSAIRNPTAVAPGCAAVTSRAMPWHVRDGRNSEGLHPGSAALQIALHQNSPPMQWPCAADQSPQSNANMSVMGATPRACMSGECDTANCQVIRFLYAVALSCPPLTSEQCHGMSAMGVTPRACMSRECDYANPSESDLPMQWPWVAQQSPPSNALACQRCARLRGPAYLQLPRGEARTTSPAP